VAYRVRAVEDEDRCEAMATGTMVSMAIRRRCRRAWREVVSRSFLCRRHAQVFRAGRGLRHDAADAVVQGEIRRRKDAASAKLRDMKRKARLYDEIGKVGAR
jgi:hypothetical protein